MVLLPLAHTKHVDSNTNNTDIYIYLLLLVIWATSLEAVISAGAIFICVSVVAVYITNKSQRITPCITEWICDNKDCNL